MDPHEQSDRDELPDDRPVQGQVRHESVTALVPRDVASGVFSNGILILTGPHEVVLDFLLRMGEQQRVAARIILPHVVGRQFVAALDHDIQVYQAQYGPLPRVPRPMFPSRSPRQREGSEEPSASWTMGPAEEQTAEQHPENLPEPPRPLPTAEDIYHDLKLPDELLAGAYANGVLIRHTGTEFCFDFITNIYPRSAVSARVYLAAPHVGPLLKSLTQSLTPPPEGPRLA